MAVEPRGEPEWEKALGAKAPALRELLVGAPLSDRSRDNRLKKYAEILAWDPKALAASLEEHREKAREAARREARKVMEAAFAALVRNPDAAEAQVRQAEKARDAWETLRRSIAPDVARMKEGDPDARLRWLRKQGLTRPGADALAAAYVFCDEDFVSIPPEMLVFLAKRGFDTRDAEILVYELELKEQIARRMEAERAAESK
jgi:hypothetical protein